MIGGLIAMVGLSVWLESTTLRPAPTAEAAPAALVSLVPARLLETRSGSSNTTIDGRFQGIGRRPAGGTIELTVSGRGGVPASASAVMLNLTAVAPSGAGHVTVWPCGGPRPTTSNLNYTAGSVVANAALARIGDGGKVCIFTHAVADLVVDVNGYAPEPGFESLVPARLLETRSGPSNTTIDGRFQGIGRRPAASTTELTVTGRGGVPGDAVAVMLNVTAIAPSHAGHVTVWPCGSRQPHSSNLNFTVGAVVANTVLAKAGVDGKVCIFTGESDMVVDVTGYVPAGGSVGTLVPARLLETRSGLANTTIDDRFQGIGRQAAGATVELIVSNRGGVPDSASAVMLNVTAITPSAPGHVTVWPCGSSRPTASNLNYAAGTVVANAVLAKVGDGGRVCITTHAEADLVADVNGWLPAAGTVGTSFEPLVVRTDGSVYEELHFGNMRPLAKRSAGLDGSTIVFASRNGMTEDNGYAPIAHREQCVIGVCSDLYVRDLKAGTTVSVSAGIRVDNQQPRSFWPYAYAHGSWAVSADHDTFLMTYSCYQEFGWGSEIIGGTAVCRHEDPDDGRPLVLHRRSTGFTEVVGFQWAEAIDVSDDGATALFTDIGDAPAPCFAKEWDCAGYGNERLAVWRQGIGVVPVSAKGASFENGDAYGQLQVGNSVVSGDGKIVIFDAHGFRFTGSHFEPDEFNRLYRHVLDTGVTTEISIPDERYPAGSWRVIDTDRRGNIVALSYLQQEQSPNDPEFLRGRLFVVDVVAGTTREVTAAPCGFVGSMTSNGQYLTCPPDGHVDRPPLRVDLRTGEIGELFPPGTSLSRFFDPFLSRDGGLAVTTAVTGQSTRQRGSPFDEQLFAVTIAR